MDTPENIGVINPYALTEVLTGRKINWKDPKSHHVIEEVLETDYDKLFDPKYNSPLYSGLKLTDENKLVPIKEKDIQIRDINKNPNLSPVKKIGDLSKLGIDNVKNLNVESSHINRGKLNLSIKTPKLDNTLTNKRVSKLLKEVALPYGKGNENKKWSPSNVTWMDKGDFFKDTDEYDDPIQGAVANCYFIAAMAAVAWANPYLIAHRERPTGSGEEDRTNMIKFFSKGGGKDAPTKEIEVTDKVPVSSNNKNYIYCRSNDAGEIWPALYEKAFAKWITKNNTDEPNITKTAFGSPVKALAQITNKKPHAWRTKNISAGECYHKVRANSLSYRTINPMTAWTYGSGDKYHGSHIAANHAYTILGWAYKNNQKYIILRNPWGVTEPAGMSTYQGVVPFFDVSFWKYINLVGNDGVFALKAKAFKNYFAGLAVVK